MGDGQFEQAEAWITVHRPAKGNGTAVVICPGGGYGRLVVGPEGHGIAEWLNRHGITGVVLEYRLPAGRSSVPLLDAQRAIRTVRAKATEWGVEPSRVGIMGFSAGGHLAATAGTHFDDGDPNAVDPVNRVGCRPDFLILVYPVITMGEKTHAGSRDNLLGKNAPAKLIEQFSNEKQVSERTPPAFLAHAQDDKPVSPENSKAFYNALQARKIASKYLELPSGGHGLNGYKGPMWDAWQEKSLEWLSGLKFTQPVGSSAAGAAPPARPNVVVILADDLGYADLGCQGSREVRSPQIDSMAGNGVRCTAGYVTAPQCCPSRAGLMTGRYQNRFGFEANWRVRNPQAGLPADQPTIADRLKAAGYVTGVVGKWHLGDAEPMRPHNRGFVESVWNPNGGVLFTDPKTGTLPGMFRGADPVELRKYSTDAFTDEAVEFIERHQREPFFLYLAYVPPHWPMQAKPEHLAQFAHVPDLHRRTFLAMMASLDENVGRVQTKLHFRRSNGECKQGFKESP